MNPQLHVVEALDLAVERIDHELHFLVIFAVGVRHEVEGGFLDLDTAAAGVAQRQQFLVHGLRHVPDHLTFVLVLGRVDVQEQRHHLRAAGAELDRLARLGLRHAP